MLGFQNPSSYTSCEGRPSKYSFYPWVLTSTPHLRPLCTFYPLWKNQVLIFHCRRCLLRPIHAETISAHVTLWVGLFLSWRNKMLIRFPLYYIWMLKLNIELILKMNEPHSTLSKKRQAVRFCPFDGSLLGPNKFCQRCDKCKMHIIEICIEVNI